MSTMRQVSVYRSRSKLSAAGRGVTWVAYLLGAGVAAVGQVRGGQPEHGRQLLQPQARAHSHGARALPLLQLPRGRLPVPKVGPRRSLGTTGTASTAEPTHSNLRTLP